MEETWNPRPFTFVIGVTHSGFDMLDEMETGWGVLKEDDGSTVWLGQKARYAIWPTTGTLKSSDC
ncbi:hypothetical protein PABG_12243 [Paracoccidioides brasiliensis Pb03]|uniref:Uncharacterized protein n=2 Tax=Paracoccidioides brasiliensis TaxID=121759 RepID=A0A0A0HTX7_PARBD|nr:uncharacterized protein PADG_12181 [Paracoccidioides brasiliensis Pb18]KGM91723.1 hypothetical protein PADG_12181 [Paracoccidioides brasiliensis Pb18]KGY14852.1 hypothetical protein PABG_12243 [Paracoccidioides brasiliensis Pb03]ODH26945.1 hypothetical protein ACO22_04343 [Paracoccidioides brasiliensis]ODH53258.1 hypothetical protein GX48_00454 [Paracoccidioides brasiliensis]